MKQWGYHWPGSFIISNTGEWLEKLHSRGDRQQTCNKHLVYLFNVFFKYLELPKPALNINTNFSYISISASHLGTFWKSMLYFSSVPSPLSASKPDTELLTSKKPAEWNLGDQPLEAVIMCSPYNGHCKRAEDVTCWLNVKAGMPCDNL